MTQLDKNKISILICKGSCFGITLWHSGRMVQCCLVKEKLQLPFRCYDFGCCASFHSVYNVTKRFWSNGKFTNEAPN